MKSKQIILLTPYNEKISGNYLQIGNYLLEQCKHYCMEESGRKKLEAFQKEYDYFSPYFDFCLKEFGYVLIHALMEQDVVWYYEKEAIRRKRIPNVEQLTYQQIINNYDLPCTYPLLNRNEIKVHEIDYSKSMNSIISPDCVQIEVSIEKKQHHDDVFERILNEKLLTDVIWLEDYEKNQKQYNTINAYFRQQWGYVQVATISEEGFILYNPEFELPQVEAYLQSMKLKYPNYHIVKDVPAKNFHSNVL